MKQRAAFAGRQDELAVQRRKASHLVVSVDALEHRLLSMRRCLDESEFTLEPAGRVNQRIASLTELVNECGLKTNEIQLGKVIKGSKCSIVPISLAGFGSYKRSTLFLHRLSETCSDLAVVSFEISGNPQKPDEGGKFRFGLYWYAAPGTKPARK